MNIEISKEELIFIKWALGSAQSDMAFLMMINEKPEIYDNLKLKLDNQLTKAMYEGLRSLGKEGE